jgi:hypothetical protein
MNKISSTSMILFVIYCKETEMMWKQVAVAQKCFRVGYSHGDTMTEATCITS